MTDILMRVELHNQEQARETLARHALPWVGEQLKAGRELVAEFRLLDDDITMRQRAYLHAVVLTEISLYGKANGGALFQMPTWKEYFRQRLLPDKRVTSINPITGRRSRRRVRVSTEDLGVRRMAAYIDEVIAIAADELGVVVSIPLPPELRPQRKKAKRVNQDTGEVINKREVCLQ